jgi:hypothetical protein
MSNMLRTLVAGLVLALCVCGCFGGSAREDEGTLDPSVLERTADRATFHVRLPSRLGAEYELLSVGRITGPSGHFGVDFDLVAGEGPILSVSQGENAGTGVIRSFTKGARLLGKEVIAAAVWRVYDQPDVGGLVYARRYRDGVEVVLAGGPDRGPLRALARSLGPPL